MVSDAELAVAAASGDRAALADIYDRYGNMLYELCRAMLHDPHEAADAAQDTFVIAATRLSGLREPSRLKPWLCAIARHESMRRSSKRARNRPVVDEVLEVPVIDQSADGLVADDASKLVWESAEALTDRERAVLMLNVRQGLEGADLAAAAGLKGPECSVLLSRAKSQLAIAVKCTMLIRSGREACTELSSIVPRKHAVLDGLTRKRVARHAPACATCEPTWNKSPEAMGVLAAAPLLGAPIGLRHKVLNDPRLISFSSGIPMPDFGSEPLGAGKWQSDGFPPAEPEENSRRPIIAALVAAVLLLGTAVGLVFASNEDTPRLAALPDGVTETTIEEAFEPWPSDADGTTIAGNTTTTRKGATTTTVKKTTTTTRPTGSGGGGTATTVTTAAPTTTTIPRLIISASSRSSTLGCGQGTTVSASTSGRAMAADEGLILSYRDASGSGGTVSMSRSGNTWTGNLGGFSTAGRATWTVSSTKPNSQSSSGAITVESTRENPCGAS